MENFFNRKVDISYTPKSWIDLEWHLNEYDQNGTIANKDLIPWKWTLDFTCETLSVRRLISNTRIFFEDGSSSELKKSIKINGKLASIGGEWNQALDYSFLGTDRKIETFNFEINEATDDEPEGCSLFGFPKFEYESSKNFSKVVSNDMLWISVRLKTEKINEIASLIDKNLLENVVLSIGSADGLFSKWSPTSYTNFIKILADGCEIEGLNSEKNKPLIVGNVEEFTLALNSKEFQLVSTIDADAENSKQEILDRAASDHNEWIKSLIANAVTTTSSSLKSLLLPLWLIFTLLIFLLFK